MNIPEISPYLPTYATKPVMNNPVLPSAPAPFLSKRTIEYVKGQEGAQNFQMAPGSSALLLDQDMDVLWVVATDQNGAKSLVKGYRIGDEYEPPKPVTLEDLMAQMQSMNERLNKMEENANGQQNRGPAVRNESGGNGRTGQGNLNGRSAADHAERS